MSFENLVGNDKVKNIHDVSKMQYVDLKMWMTGDILLKADRMSMSNSLELRVPFLDKEVFKVASKINPKWNLKDKTTKSGAYAFYIQDPELKKNVAYTCIHGLLNSDILAFSGLCYIVFALFKKLKLKPWHILAITFSLFVFDFV